MMTTLLRSQTLAALPNSRWNTPMVPGPQTSCVIRTSAWTQTLSPASTRALPDARASIVSVKVINHNKLVDRAPEFNTQYPADLIGLDPNIVPGFNPGFARRAGQYRFCQSHKPQQASGPGS